MFKPAMKLGAVVVLCATAFACGDDGEGTAGTGGGGAGGGSGGVSGMMAGVGGMTGGAGGGGMTGGAGGGGMTGGAGGGGMTGGVGGGGMTGGVGGGGMGGTPPTGDPTWPAIYAEIIMAKGCAVGAQCHGGPGGGLNMTTIDGAYDALINIDAMGINPIDGNCLGTGLKRVVPMQPDMSLLVQKISHTQTCGAPMPPGAMLEAAQIEQVRMWIMAGAAEM